MNILMTVTNPYSNDPRVRREAEALAEAGHEVRVIAWDRNGRLSPMETISGVEVFRISNSLFMKMLPFDSMRLPLWRARAVLIASRYFAPCDVIHCHDFDSLPIGIELKKRLKKPLIYDIHEIYGYMVSKDLPWWKRYIEMEKRLVQEVDMMITVCEPLQKYYDKFFNNENYPDECWKPIYLVKNCKEFDGLPYQPPTAEPFVVIYAGTIGESREILELIDAVGRMNPPIRFIIAGSGKKKYVKAVIEHSSRTSNVWYSGSVPQAEVARLTKRCHAGVCLLGKGTESNKMALPNKLFESMVAGRPLFTTRGLHYSDVADRLGFGIPVSNIDEFVTELKSLASDPERCERLGRKALEAASDYNWENEKKKLLEVYSHLNYITLY